MTAHEWGTTGTMATAYVAPRVARPDDRAAIQDAVQRAGALAGNPAIGRLVAADHCVLTLEVALAHARRWQRQEHDDAAQMSGSTRRPR